MPTIAESCLRFRQETLAPSGGWLASLAIGLSLSTGIYEYTILGIVFMLSFIVIRTASCESAMVLALAYDLIIPFQYQNVNRHLAELERYWPRFVVGCMIEGLCYILLHPDLFNLAVIGKTTVMLTIWMSGKKQYPLNLKSDATPPSLETSLQRTRNTRDEDTRPSASKDKLPDEYLKYVNSALKTVEGAGRVDDNKRRQIMEALQRPDKRKAAEQSLTKRKIPTYEEWKKSMGEAPSVTPESGAAPATGESGSMPTFDTMGAEQLKQANEALKQTGTLDDLARQKLTKRLGSPFADPDWESARKEAIAAGVNVPEARQLQAALQAQWRAEHIPPKDPNWTPSAADLAAFVADLKKRGAGDAEDIIKYVEYGPNHPNFHSVINYARGRGVDTRKWVPHVPFPKGLCGQQFTMPYDIQQKIKPILRARYESTKNYDVYGTAIKRSTMEAISLKEFQQRMARMEEACPGLGVSGVQPEINDLSAWGGLQADYYEGLRMAREAGGDYEAEYITLHDWLSDPVNRKNPNQPDKQRDAVWDQKIKDIQKEYTKGKPDRYKDGYKGKAGIPIETILEYRDNLDSLQNYAEGVKDAILYEVKNAPSAVEGKSIWERVWAASKTMAGQTKMIDEFLPKSPSVVTEDEAREEDAWMASVSG